jgi:hypothetical protein
MRWSILCILWVLIFCSTAVASSDIPVGTIKTVTGAASIVREQKVLPVMIGDRILEGDTLRTGTDGSLGTILKDDTFISLGPNSELAISEFIFVPAEGKFSIITRMLKGTATYLSGVIAKLSPQSVRFETPVASVGIRGTKFLVNVNDD